MSQSLVSLNVRVPEDLREEFRAVCEHRDVPMGRAVREALRAWMGAPETTASHAATSQTELGRVADAVGTILGFVKKNA